jgi:hypothetical protein
VAVAVQVVVLVILEELEEVPMVRQVLDQMQVVVGHKLPAVSGAILKVEQPMDQHCKAELRAQPEILVAAVAGAVATGAVAQAGMVIVQQVILVEVVGPGITTRCRSQARH